MATTPKKPSNGERWKTVKLICSVFGVVFMVVFWTITAISILAGVKTNG